jgi:RecA/RadA recombinase
VAAWIPSLALAAHLVPARQLERRDRRERLPTGSAPLDALIGGGWPKGALSELAGGRSTGRTALLLSSLAEALRKGETVALVDVGGMLDARAAARGGLSLARLLWIRCDPEKALAAAEIALSAGGFGMVALDAGEPRLHAPSAAWLRLKRGAEQQGTAVLVTSARRLQGALGACAVTLAQGRPRFAGRTGEGQDAGVPPLLVGLEASASAERGGAEKVEPPRLTFALED